MNRFRAWMWIIFIILMTLGWLGGMARADVVKDAQDIVVDLNNVTIKAFDKWEDFQQNVIPLDNVRLVIKPKFIRIKVTF